MSVSECFQEFQQDALLSSMQGFSDRVSPEQDAVNDTDSLYPPCHFDFFHAMWKRMSQEERSKHFVDVVRLYERLLLKYVRSCYIPHYVQEIVPFLRRTFTDLLHFARSVSSEEVSHLVSACRDALDFMELGNFLRIVPREDTEVLFEHLPTPRRSPPYRFNGWGTGLIYSRALMRALKSMRYKTSTVPLIQFIRYGFPYRFDNEYFSSRGRQLLNGQLKINGKMLSQEINLRIFRFGNLRLQMALELLVTLFANTGPSSDRDRQASILGLLWQAIPFPYIASEEMFFLLKPFFKGDNLHLREVCNEYKMCNTIFEVPEVIEPRSLKHQSRVQIRKKLFDANALSDEDIDLMDIPLTFKDYLKLPLYKKFLKSS